MSGVHGAPFPLGLRSEIDMLGGSTGRVGGWVVIDPRELALSRDVEEVRTCRGVPGRGGEGTGRDRGRGGTPRGGQFPVQGLH